MGSLTADMKTKEIEIMRYKNRIEGLQAASRVAASMIARGIEPVSVTGLASQYARWLESGKTQ